jgi:hypothetical protein
VQERFAGPGVVIPMERRSHSLKRGLVAMFF